MGRILLLVLLVLIPVLPVRAQVSEPAGPEVDASEGAQLAALARSAMHTYLIRRIPAEKQAVPAELDRLADRPLTAAVTLRRDGRVVAQVVQSGNSLPRNVMDASLEAMRSPAIGDVVTEAVLNGLLVEVEVLGAPVLAAQEPPSAEGEAPRRRLPPEVERMIVPGLTGLKLTRGQSSSYALPSQAFAMALDAAGMRRWCMEHLTLTRENAAQNAQWSLFASQHFVSYPRGRVVRLYRGKVLVPPEAVTEASLAETVRQVARYLALRQEPSGRLLAEGQPSLMDHLYATWSLARVPAVRTDKKLAACLNGAMGFAAQFVRRKDQTAYVQTDLANDQLAATAMLALATAGADDGKSAEGNQLRQQLLAGLRGAIVGGEFRCRLDGQASPPASPKAVCLARLALSQGADSAAVARLPGFSERTETLSGEQMLWALRAGVPISGAPGGLARHFRDALAAGMMTFAPAEAPQDERGGLRPADSPARTEPTALACLVLKRILADPQIAAGPQAAELARQRLEGRRFCHRMTVRPTEAFFAAQPDQWEGAVRLGPESANIQLRACAAAIEAMLE